MLSKLPHAIGLLIVIVLSGCSGGHTVLSHQVLHQSTIDDVALDAVAVNDDGTVIAVGGRAYEFGYVVRNTQGEQVGPKRFFALRRRDSSWISTGIDGYWYSVTSTAATAIDRLPIFKPIRDFAFKESGSGLAVSGKALATGEIYTLDDSYRTVIDTVLEHELLGVTTSCGGIVCGYGGIFKRYDDTWTYISTPADFYSDIVVAGDDLYAVGIGGQIIRSADCGDTWSSVHQAGASLSQLAQLEGIDYRQGYFAVAGDGIIITSRDGKSWDTYTTDTRYHYSDVAISDTRLYLTTYDGALISVPRP